MKPPVDAPTSTARAPVDVDAERVERARELRAAARHERRRPSARRATTIGSAASTWRAAVVAGVPLTDTRPAAIASTARARLGASPRRTSSTSRRRRTAQRARLAAGFLAAFVAAPSWPRAFAAAVFFAAVFFAAGFLAAAFFAAGVFAAFFFAGFLAAAFFVPAPSSRRRLARAGRFLAVEPRAVRRRSSASRSRLRREPEHAELALHLGADDRAQLLAAAAADLDELVDRGAELIAGELALGDQVGREPVGLRAAQLGELHAGLEHTLPVRRLGHRYLFRSRRGGTADVGGRRSTSEYRQPA